MSDLWTVVGAVTGVVSIAIAAFVAGVKRGAAKTKRALNDHFLYSQEDQNKRHAKQYH